MKNTNTTYEVYIDFGSNIKAANAMEAKKKAIEMIEADAVQVLRILEKATLRTVHEVIDGYTHVDWEEEK